MLVTGTATAGSLHSDGYTVRYNVVNSRQIPAHVADDIGITPDNHTAIVTVTLQQPTDDDPYHNVAAHVTGNSRTLLTASHTLKFRRIHSKDSVYSVAILPLRDAEQTVTIALEIKTTDGSALIPVRFTQKVFAR